MVLLALSTATRLYALKRPAPDGQPVKWLGAITGITLVLIPVLAICAATIVTLRSPDTLKVFS
jgi:hypothetical protein